MKNMKKVIAVLLCLCMAMSAMVFSVSAEDAGEEPKTEGLSVGTVVQVTELKEGDNETVLRLKMTVRASKDEIAFDTVNRDAEITICEGLYFSTIGLLEGASDEVVAKTMIAKAKPVSYEDDVLTVDVYAKDGSKGAKMVAIELQADDYHDYSSEFAFVFPAGLFKDSVSGVVSAAAEVTCEVEGLTAKQIKLSKLISGVLPSVISGAGSTTGRFLLLIFFFPVYLVACAVEYNDYFKIYGFNSYQIMFQYAKTVASALIQLLPELFHDLISRIKIR